jgi:hypothetical protein
MNSRYNIEKLNIIAHIVSINLLLIVPFFVLLVKFKADSNNNPSKNHLKDSNINEEFSKNKFYINTLNRL